MAVQFGVVKTTDGLGAAILQSANTTDSIQTAQAQDEYGNVIALNGYGRTNGGSFSVLLDGALAVKAGDVITVSAQSVIVTNANTTQTNTGYAEGSVDYEGAPGVVPVGPISGGSN